MAANATTDATTANRARAGVRVIMAPGAPVSRLVDLTEWGGYRVKFPDPEGRAEGVLINTGGGMAGGDALDVSVALQPGAALTFTGQSAERIYRTTGPATTVDISLTVGSGADLAFVPQETILFSGARLQRRIAADVASSGRLLLAESVVFGRSASGETITTGSLADRWRVRRDGRLVYADDVRFDGPLSAHLARPAIGAAAGAAGCALYLGPDAPDRLDDIRAGLTGASCRAAASTWNGLLAVRTLGNPAGVRLAMAAVIARILRRSMPRVWLM